MPRLSRTVTGTLTTSTRTLMLLLVSLAFVPDEGMPAEALTATEGLAPLASEGPCPPEAAMAPETRINIRTNERRAAGMTSVRLRRRAARTILEGLVRILFTVC